MLDKRSIIQYRTQKAHETLNAAKLLIDAGYYASALNRIYYACFYMVNALLLTKNFSSSKHSGVKSLFNRHFVKENIFDRKWGVFYSTLFLNRQMADYDDLSTIECDFVINKYNESKEFIKQIELFTKQFFD